MNRLPTEQNSRDEPPCLYATQTSDGCDVLPNYMETLSDQGEPTSRILCYFWYAEYDVIPIFDF